MPCRLTEVEGQVGRAELDGASVEVRLDLVDDAKVGDYVLIHAGFALERLDEADAEETLALFAQLNSQQKESGDQ